MNTKGGTAMKQLALILAAAALVGGSAAGLALAAKPKEAPAVGLKEEQKTKGMADAPAVIAAAGLKCTPKAAAFLGAGSKDVDKKKVKIEVYELACQEGPGYIVSKPEAGEPEAFNCIKAKSAFDGAGGKGQLCQLPENASLAPQIQPSLAASGAACTASQVVWLGSSATSKVDRYEVACSDGGGYVLDVPLSGETPKAPISCIQAETGGYDCRFTPKAARLTQISALATATPGGKSCQVSDARWVGSDPKTQHDFYEIACTGKVGFFLETAKGAAVRDIDCVRAATIGGGCKMSDMTAARTAAAQSYSALLKTNGVTCSSTEFRVVGRENAANRDVVEFRCPERPAGLIAMIPGSGSTAKFEQMDCFSAGGRSLTCELTDKPAMLAMLKKILTAVDKVCDPSEFRVVGADETDGDYVEVKCGAGQQGYVVDLPPSRAKTNKTLTCTQAARGINKCTIPGNT
jgi:hypothetical protein